MKKILLVEGPMPVRELNGSLFRRRECVLEVASSGSEAIALMRAAPPDLVIYDAGVPDQGAAEFVAASGGPGGVPVVVLLDDHEEEQLDAVLEAGAAAALARPIDQIDLNQILCDLLGISLRRHLRTFVKIRVDATIGADTRFATIRDISLGGLLVESEKPISLGTIIKLAFFLPNDDVPVTAISRVVRSAGEAGTSYGCEFLDLSADARQRIHDFVSVAEAEE